MRTDQTEKDLRAALKLQSQNTEAVNELLSLIPPVPTPALIPSVTATPPPPSSSSATGPSSSSKDSQKTSNESTQKTDSPDQDLFDRLGVPKPKKPKDPPFPRVRNDNRKLKIVLLPSSNTPFPPPLDGESLLTTAGFECEHSVGCAHWLERERALTAEKEGKGGGKDMKGKGKGKVKGEKTKEIEKMKAEGVSYPSWERYVVKLV